MMARLTVYEVSMLWRDRRARWSLITFGALILLAFASTATTALRNHTDAEEIAAAERVRWLGQGEKDPHSAAHYSIYAFKPPAPLSPLDPGVDPFVGQALWLEAHSRHDALYRPQQEASALRRTGSITPATLLFGFAPLVIFLLAFTAVAQDRERGTLRLALGATARPSRIIWPKALAIWVVGCVALVLPVALSAVSVTVVTRALTFDDAIRLLGWTLLGIGYCALIAAVGIAVVLRAPSARIALALLFGAWLLFGLALPRLASVTAERVRPLPSSQSVKQTLLDEAPVYWDDEASRAYVAELLSRYGAERREDLPVDARGAELDLAERHSHEVIDRVLGGLYDQTIAQDRVFAIFGVFSPTIAAQSLSAALTGSDFTHHRAFLDGAEAYRRDLVARMNADVMVHPLNRNEPRHHNNETLWAQIPAFVHRPRPLSAGLGPALPALGVMLLWSGAALTLVARTARRLRP